MKNNYRDELFLTIAWQVTNENWKKWREDAEKCNECKVCENGDIQPCEDHYEWRFENEYFDTLILKVIEEKSVEK